jgi:hypothetical protein
VAETTHEDRAYGFGAAVYGSILVASLVGAMFEEGVSPRTMTLSLTSSVVVFWVAHAWSEIIGARVEQGRLFDPSRIRAIAIREWPLVEAGMLPAILLALAWAGLYSRHAGAVLALTVAVLQLVAWGILAGHRSQPTWLGAILVGLFDGFLGVAIVVLEVLVHR